MLHEHVYDIYKGEFPNHARRTIEYFPCGKNVIRVRLEGDDDYIFQYKGKKDWIFMPVKTFTNQMKEEKKKNERCFGPRVL